MKSRSIILLASMLAATAALAQAPGTPAHPDTANPAGKSPSGVPADINFMKTLAMGGMAEVEAGKLAASKASNTEVKDFAEKMVSDHTKNNEHLKTLATQKKVDLPSAVDADHAAEKAKLEKASGADFDAAYMQGQVKDHQQTVQLLQHEINAGQDVAVRAFAQETLITVQHHLEMAKELEAKVSHKAP